MKKPFLSYLLLVVAGLVSPLFPVRAVAAPGDLYVSEFGSADDRITRITPAGVKNLFYPGLDHPKGITFDAKGNLYVLDYSNTIIKITPAGVKTTFASPAFNDAFGLVFDGAGNLFVADHAASGQLYGAIYKFTPAGVKTVFASSITGPNAMAFDRSGNLFVADSATGGATGGTIIKITPTGVKSTFATGLTGLHDLTFDSAGNLFVSSRGNGGAGVGSILRFTPQGTKSTFASSLTEPYGLVFDRFGYLYVAEGGGTNNNVLAFNPNGAKTTLASGIGGGMFLAFEPELHQLLNISTRGFVGTGENVLIAGFIVGGNGQVNGTVMARAIGPSLANFGVAGAIPDPTLEIHDGSGALLSSNDDWRSAQQTEILATGLQPGNDKESAILTMLPAGNFTVVVRGTGNSTGVAVVEVYNLP